MIRIGYIGQDPLTYLVLRRDRRLQVVFTARIAWLGRPFGNVFDRMLARIYRARMQGPFPDLLRPALRRLLPLLGPFLSPHGRRYLPLVADLAGNTLVLADPDSAAGVQLISKSGAVLAVVSWWDILPSEMLRLFPLGLVNVHPSILPKYRGALPTLWALKHGDSRSGVSFLVIETGVDTGPVLECIEFEIAAHADWETLEHSVARTVADHLPRVLAGYASGRIQPRPQNHGQATHTASYGPYQRLRPDRERARDACNKIGLYPCFDPAEQCYFATPDGPVPVRGGEWLRTPDGASPPVFSHRRGWIVIPFLEDAVRLRVGRDLTREDAARLVRAFTPPSGLPPHLPVSPAASHRRQQNTA